MPSHESLWWISGVAGLLLWLHPGHGSSKAPVSPWDSRNCRHRRDRGRSLQAKDMGPLAVVVVSAEAWPWLKRLSRASEREI